MTRDSIDFEALALHQPCLVMRTDFRIVWVSDAYRRDTLLLDRRIVGQYMFDVFPDNPGVSDHDGVQNLRASLQTVLRRAKPDPMPTQRYDVRDYVGGRGGTCWHEKYWAVVNRPILVPGGSEVKYLLHEVTDISAAVRLSRRLKDEAICAAEQAGSLRQMLDEQMERERRLREAGGQVERLLRGTPGVTGDDVMRYVDELSAALGWPLPPGEYVRPGEIAPVTGVYESFHLRGCHTLNPHRLLRAEMPAPTCSICGDAVLFRVPPNPHRIN